MARVYHCHHYYLYRNQHWFPLHPVNDSLECGIKNETTKRRNLVPLPKVHISKIRWPNLTSCLLLEKENVCFSTEIKQFLT